MNTRYTRVTGYMVRAAAVLFLVPSLCTSPIYAQNAKSTKQSSNPKNNIITTSKEDAKWQKGGVFEGFTPNQEIKEKRSKNTKHFRNANGSITAQIGRTLHYKAADGSWQDINLSILPDRTPNYYFKNETNNIKSYFPESAGQQGVSMKLESGVQFNWWKTPSLKFTNNGQVLKTFAPMTVRGTAQGEKLLYSNVYNGISEEFVVLTEGLENNTIIHSLTPEMSALQGNSALEFTQFIPLKSGWQVIANDNAQSANFEASYFSIRMPGAENNLFFGRIVVFDNNISKDDAMLVNAPFEKLSAEQKSKLEKSVYTIDYKVKFVNGGIEITSSLPASWLKAATRSFPVVIDPTVTITPTAAAGTYYGPLSHWYGYQRHADLFLQSEIGDYGSITQIEYNSTTDGTAGSRPTKVYMRTTPATTLTGTDAWNSTTYTSGASICLDANTDQGNTIGWKPLVLTAPFTYNQDNLLIMVNDSWGGSGSVKYYNISTTTTARQAQRRTDVTDPGDATTTSVENCLPEIRITYDLLSACTGIPTLGTPTASATEVCLGSSFNLNLTGVTPASGITFQWQSSTNGGTTWTDLGAAQPGPFYAVTNQTQATQYRVIVTCVPTSTSETSGTVSVAMGIPTNCYCTPSPSTCSVDDEIQNVTFEAINNNSSCTAGGYANYIGTIAPVTITTGLSYPISVTTGPGGNEAVVAWIDYDQSGTFDPSEYTYIGNTPGGTVSGTINIPATALAGATRIRVRSMYVTDTQDPETIFNEAASPACGVIGIGYGETEDYALTIVAGTNCSGMPAAGTATASQTSVCPESPIALGLTGSPQAIGITYQWQASTNAGTTWTNIGASQPFPSYTVYTQTQATQYRVIITCSNSSESATSAPVSVAQNIFSDCYCINAIPYNCADGDVITNVTFATINNNSSCGNTTTGYSDYTTTVAAPQITAGTTVPVSVTVGPSGDGWLYESAAVWIDFNQNGLLDSVEFEYTDLGTGLNQALTGNVIVPPNALPGPTRMRVIVAASRDIHNAFVCGPLVADENFGEMEDYTVNIIGAIDSVVVTTQGNVPAVIATPTGNLQLEAKIYPLTSNQAVTWSIVPVTGTATISATGLVTAQTVGTVWGKAVSVQNTTKADSILITINAPLTVDSVVVKTVGNISANISTPHGTLPLQATIYPTSLSQAVTWSIVPVTGTANISATGLVTAQTNGTVWGKAKSVLNPLKSDSILITITNQDLGIKDLTGFDFTLYPNPTEDVVVLKSANNHTALELQLTDLSGKILARRTVQANELNSGVSVDLSTLSSGMYLLKLEGESVRIHRQVVKK